MKLSQFIEVFKPSSNLTKGSKELIADYKDYLPQCILELWSEHGFGTYGNGLIQIINPDLYKENLWGWLMTDEDLTRIPVAISAFGDIFYYRQLDDEGSEDIAYIDPHTSATGVLAWSAEEFFNEWCCDEEVISDFFRKEEVKDVEQLKGSLTHDEIYYYAPALRLGGTPSINTMDRGNALAQLDILLQLALDS